MQKQKRTSMKPMKNHGADMGLLAEVQARGMADSRIQSQMSHADNGAFEREGIGLLFNNPGCVPGKRHIKKRGRR